MFPRDWEPSGFQQNERWHENGSFIQVCSWIFWCAAGFITYVKLLIQPDIQKSWYWICIFLYIFINWILNFSYLNISNVMFLPHIGNFFLGIETIVWFYGLIVASANQVGIWAATFLLESALVYDVFSVMTLLTSL